MEAARREVVDKVAEEASVEGVAVVAGWEATVLELVPLGIVSAPVAERDCPIKQALPATT